VHYHFPLCYRVHHQPAVSLLSEYVQGLPESAKSRYLQKLREIGCTVEPYVDSYDNQLSLLSPANYSDICDLIEYDTINGNDLQKAFKVLIAITWYILMVGWEA